MSEPDTSESEPPVTTTQDVIRKVRTPAQASVLAAAREKALAIRRENAEIRAKSKEVEKLRKEKSRGELKASVEAAHAALQKADEPKVEAPKEERGTAETVFPSRLTD